MIVSNMGGGVNARTAVGRQLGGAGTGTIVPLVVRVFSPKSGCICRKKNRVLLCHWKYHSLMPSKFGLKKGVQKQLKKYEALVWGSVGCLETEVSRTILPGRGEGGGAGRRGEGAAR